MIINAPTIRTVQFENLTFSPLLLELVASQPEDVELFVKAEDAPVGVKAGPGKYAETTAGPERAISPPNGELKERFMETMRELSVKTDGPATKAKAVKAKGSKLKDKTEQTGADEVPKLSVGASMMAALKKGGRGKPVQVSCLDTSSTGLMKALRQRCGVQRSKLVRGPRIPRSGRWTTCRRAPLESAVETYGSA